MGLDMYLEKVVYIGANYEHNKVEGEVNISIRGEKIDIDLKKITTITESVGYWRKANQIHKWFVDNVQDGSDDCKKYEVSYEELMKLKKLCEKVLETKDGKLLPPQEGFFFGNAQVDEYYFQCIENTLEILKNINDQDIYLYFASW